jgi:hypothetical protein
MGRYGILKPGITIPLLQALLIITFELKDVFFTLYILDLRVIYEITV